MCSLLLRSKNKYRKLRQESKFLPLGKYYGDLNAIRQFVRNRHSVAGGFGGRKKIEGRNEYADLEDGVNVSAERIEEQ